MLTDSKIKIGGRFDLASKDVNADVNADYLKITLTDVTDYEGEGVDVADIIGYFKVIAPTGVDLYEGSFLDPDIDANVSLEFDGIEVPLDSLGNPMTGEYILQYFVKNTDTDAEYTTGQIKVKVCGSKCIDTVDICIELTFDCNTGIAKGTDVSVYGTGAVVDSIISLSPPLGATYTDGTRPSVYQSPTKAVVSDALWTGVWQLFLSSVVEYSVVVGGMTFVIVEYFESAANGEANCSVNISALYECLVKRCTAIEKEACSYGGISNNKVLADEQFKLLTLALKLEWARTSGDATGAAKYYEELKSLLGCTCCTSGDTPELIIPIAPTSTTAIVLGSIPIVVSPVTVGTTTTYTVSLSQLFQDLINSLFTTEVVSEDATINVTPTIDEDGNISYNIEVDGPEVGLLLLDGIDYSSLDVPPDSSWEVVFQALIDKASQVKEPVASPDSFTILVDQVLEFLPLDNDFFDADVVVTIVGPGPSNGTAVVQGDDKTIIYTPDSGWDGVETFDYTVTDAEGQTSTATITINVLPVAPATCAVINPGYIAQLDIDSGNLKIIISNTTNYDGNTPIGVDYTIQVRDNANLILHSYALVGLNDATPQEYITADAIDPAWDNVRILQVVESGVDDGAGGLDTCGSVPYETPTAFLVPDIGVEQNLKPVGVNAYYVASPNVPLTIETIADGQVPLSAQLYDVDDNSMTLETLGGVAVPTNFTGSSGGLLAVDANLGFTYTPPVDFTGREFFAAVVVDNGTPASEQAMWIVFEVFDDIHAPWLDVPIENFLGVDSTDQLDLETAEYYRYKYKFVENMLFVALNIYYVEVIDVIDNASPLRINMPPNIQIDDFHIHFVGYTNDATNISFTGWETHEIKLDPSSGVMTMYPPASGWALTGQIELQIAFTLPAKRV